MARLIYFAILIVVLIRERKSAITGIDGIFIDTEVNNEPLPDGWRRYSNDIDGPVTYDQVIQHSSSGRWYHDACASLQHCELIREFYCRYHAYVAVDWTPFFDSNTEDTGGTASLFIDNIQQDTKTKSDHDQPTGWTGFVQVDQNASFTVRFALDHWVAIADVQIACQRITSDPTIEPTWSPSVEPTREPSLLPTTLPRSAPVDDSATPSSSLQTTDDNPNDVDDGSFTSNALRALSQYFSTSNILALFLIGVCFLCCMTSCSLLIYCCCAASRDKRTRQQKQSQPVAADASGAKPNMNDAMVQRVKQHAVEMASEDDADDADNNAAVMMASLSGSTPRPPPRNSQKHTLQLQKVVSASSMSEHASDAEVMSEVCRQMGPTTQEPPLHKPRLELQFTNEATDIHIERKHTKLSAKLTDDDGGDVDSVDGIDNDSKDNDEDVVNAMDTMDMPNDGQGESPAHGEPDLPHQGSADTIGSSMAAMGDSFGLDGRDLDRVNTVNLVNDILNAEIPDKEFEIYGDS